MVDLEFLKNINLATSPWGQKFVGRAILAPNYHLFARVKIKMEMYLKQLLLMLLKMK